MYCTWRDYTSSPREIWEEEFHGLSEHQIISKDAFNFLVNNFPFLFKKTDLVEKKDIRFEGTIYVPVKKAQLEKNPLFANILHGSK